MSRFHNLSNDFDKNHRLAGKTYSIGMYLYIHMNNKTIQYIILANLSKL